MRLSLEIRCLLGDLVDKGYNKALVAKLLGNHWDTIHKWSKRRKHLRDRKRKAKESKITLEVEFSILALRNTCKWGTARIKQNLYSAMVLRC